MDFTLKNKSEIKGTHWIEFYISEPKIKYKRWSDKSKYLEEFAHNFYTDIFDKNSRHFNYAQRQVLLQVGHSLNIPPGAARD